MLQKRSKIKGHSIVGIDVSKKELVCWNQVLGVKAIPNTATGWPLLLRWLHPLSDLVVGFESTGPYGKGFQNCLQEAGILVVLVNPMHTARLKELPDNNPSKNDRKDAMLIAELVERGCYHAPIRREGIFLDLYNWHRALTRLTQQTTRLQNRRISAKDGMPMSSQEKEWIATDLRTLSTRRKDLEQMLTTGLRQVPYGEAFLGIPYLGAVTAARILGETGDLRDYRNARQVLALAGLNLSERQSGPRIGKVHLTKRGRPEVRCLVYLAALRMVRTGGEYAARYRHLVERGKPKVAAIVACSRALLRRMVAVARRHN
jgi:transposase